MIEHKILDKGFVRLVDVMGDDMAAVEAARVSFGKKSKGPEQDKALIKYLWENKHETPFEHIVFKFHIKCPIFVARQWFRHRIASYNEISFRYTEAPEEFYIPSTWRKQDTKNKQGSIEGDLPGTHLSRVLAIFCNEALKKYRQCLDAGVAREMARMFLPVNIYTQFYWTVNARSLMNFMALRSDKGAQWEIRQYSQAIEKIFREKCPWTYEAFQGL
jgi:thymidylate synthase (FAD)